MTPFMSPALEDEARAKARRSTTQDHTHACSGANAMRLPDCEEKRDPDLAKSRIKDENMELDPKARLEKQTLEIDPWQSYCSRQSGSKGEKYAV